MGDLQNTYNRTKAAIANDVCELERLLSLNQFQDIKDSLSTMFKQMAPVLMEKKQNQFKGPSVQDKEDKSKPKKDRGSLGNQKLTPKWTL